MSLGLCIAVAVIHIVIQARVHTLLVRQPHGQLRFHLHPSNLLVVVWCVVVCCVVLRLVLFLVVVLRCVVLCCVVLCCAVLCCGVLCVMFCCVLYCFVVMCCDAFGAAPCYPQGPVPYLGGPMPLLVFGPPYVWSRSSL